MFQTITESLAVGNLISQEALTELHQKGYRTVIDLCTPTEPNQLNAEEVKQIGFDYIRVPVDRQHIPLDKLAEFIQVVDATNQPVYTRCASGLRAGVMTLLTLAQREGWTEQEYLAQRQKLGIDYNHNSPVEALAREYFIESQNQFLS